MSNTAIIQTLISGIVAKIGKDQNKLSAIKAFLDAKTDFTTFKVNEVIDLETLNILRNLYKNYGNKYKFYRAIACNCIFENEENMKDIDTLNWDIYSVKHNYGFDISHTNKDGAKKSTLTIDTEVYPIVNTLPIFASPPKETFLGYRAALEVASVVSVEVTNSSTHISKNIESIGLTNATAAKTFITPESCTAVDMIDEVAILNHSQKKLVDHARDILPGLGSPGIQTYIHSLLVKPYCDYVNKAYHDTKDKYFTQPDKYTYVIKDKLIPSVPKDIQISTVSSYLAVSRNFRCSDDNGFSGYSCGYAYGVFMRKETADMLDKITFLRGIRKVYDGRRFIIYGCSAAESRYLLTNVDPPFIINGNSGYSFSSHAYVSAAPLSNDDDVIVDFTCTTLKINKDCTDATRKVLFEDDFAKYVKLKNIYYKAYPFCGEFRPFVALRSVHNMVVMYTTDSNVSNAVSSYEYLRRSFIANYIRNNWFSHVCRFSSLLGVPEMNFSVKKPYSPESKKYIEIGEILVEDGEVDDFATEGRKYIESLEAVPKPPSDYKVTVGAATSSTTTSTSSSISAVLTSAPVHLELSIPHISANVENVESEDKGKERERDFNFGIGVLFESSEVDDHDDALKKLPKGGMTVSDDF